MKEVGKLDKEGTESGTHYLVENRNTKKQNEVRDKEQDNINYLCDGHYVPSAPGSEALGFCNDFRYPNVCSVDWYLK